MNKNNKSKVTDILKDLAGEQGFKFLVTESDSDAGYIEDKKGKRYFFTYGTIDINKDAAVEVANSKPLSSEVMREVGLRVPKEKKVGFNQSEKMDHYISEAKEFTETVGFPVILKPVHGRQGKNIFKVDSIEDLESAINSIIKSEDDILIQEYIKAGEVRVVLLDGEVIQAYERDYFNIVGDGKQAISELIDSKNKYFLSRERNTVIDKNDSQILNILDKKGYKDNKVLTEGERLDLCYGRNLSRGGECNFVETQLSQEFKDILKQISIATGLRLVGFDLFLFSKPELIKDKSEIAFIEYNASPDMENNFYYDGEYLNVLQTIYKKIFTAMIAN